MTQEDKELLLKDLSSRLPYGVKIELTWWVMGEGTCINTTLEPDQIEQLLNDKDGDTEIKPYLRPMSTMTEEEKKELGRISCEGNIEHKYGIFYKSQDYLNSIHVDYRGLIPKGLAIEVNDKNNPYKGMRL